MNAARIRSSVPWQEQFRQGRRAPRRSPSGSGICDSLIRTSPGALEKDRAGQWKSWVEKLCGILTKLTACYMTSFDGGNFSRLLAAIPSSSVCLRSS